jgi:hypothetical protein
VDKCKKGGIRSLLYTISFAIIDCFRSPVSRVSFDDRSSPALSLVLIADHLAAPFHLRAAFLRLLQDAHSLCEFGIKSTRHFQSVIQGSAFNRGPFGLIGVSSTGFHRRSPQRISRLTHGRCHRALTLQDCETAFQVVDVRRQSLYVKFVRLTILCS